MDSWRKTDEDGGCLQSASLLPTPLSNTTNMLFNISYLCLPRSLFVCSDSWLSFLHQMNVNLLILHKKGQNNKNNTSFLCVKYYRKMHVSISLPQFNKLLEGIEKIKELYELETWCICVDETVLPVRHS